MEMTMRSSNAHYGATAGAIFDGFFYVLGGKHDSHEPACVLQRLSLDDSALGEMAPMPTPRGNVTAIAFDDDLYTVAGLLPCQVGDKLGSTPCRIVEAFDTKTGKWRSCAPLPAQRVKPGLAVVGGTLYAISGREDECDAATIFAYSPHANEWTTVRNDIPFSARHGAACSVDGIIYYCGGHSCRPGGGEFQVGAIAFDPKLNEVRRIAPMPAPRAAHALVAFRGSVFALGGVDAAKKATATVFRYDPTMDRWSECSPLASERAIFACDTNGDGIFLAGGWKQMRKVCNATEEFYVPE